MCQCSLDLQSLPSLASPGMSVARVETLTTSNFQDLRLGFVQDLRLEPGSRLSQGTACLKDQRLLSIKLALDCAANS